ncbi:endonuclease MutS2 [Candidatus Poribacteria bacterium]|nr:MAG: endonuclease MutS2 [Candidatus Poribacteria bacterium]
MTVNQHTLDVLEYDKIRELLVGYAASGLGARLAQEIQPLTDLHRIEQLIAETTELKRLLSPDRYLPLGGLHDLSPILEKLDKGTDILIIEEIMSIKDTLRAFRIVKGYLEDAKGDYPHLRQLAGDIRLYPDIEAKIENTLNENGAVKNSASPELKSIRKTIQTVKGRIQGRLQSTLRSKSVSPYLQDPIIRERKGRPVIAVKERDASRVPGAVRDRSDRGNTVFIEPEVVRELGNELQAAIDAEGAEIVRLLREITAKIAAVTEPMGETLKILAHLDLTYAKVRFSRDYDMNPSTLNVNGRLNLKAGRHPLLLTLQREEDSEVEAVVPINFRLGDDFNILIITGPNTGGKTITLKTVGLLTLMAQSGMHIPAGEGSELAVFSHISADIGDEQSIEQSLSTFSSHLRNIAEILSSADENSLVLLDELGGGTDPAEGAALGKSILEYLHTRNARTVVSTHISPLKNLGYTVPGIENASVEFDTVTLRPTYKLLIGTPGSSNALVIAKRLGLPDEVITNAENNSAGQNDEAAELINQLQAAKVVMEKNKRAATEANAEAARLESEYRQKLDEISAHEKEIQAQLSVDTYALLHQIKGQIDRLCQSEASRRSLLESLSEISTYMAGELNEFPEAQERQEFIHELKAGDEVRVHSLDSVGILSNVNPQTQKAVVRFGAMQMTVPLEDVGAA